jgi:N-acetylneuraminic acid mutarotase
MFGGMTNVMNNTNSLHKFDLEQRKWKKIETVNTPGPIDSHKAIISNDKMIIGMGYSEN